MVYRMVDDFRKGSVLYIIKCEWLCHPSEENTVDSHYSWEYALWFHHRQWICQYRTIAPRGNTGLDSCQPPGMFSSTNQYVTFFKNVCFAWNYTIAFLYLRTLESISTLFLEVILNREITKKKSIKMGKKHGNKWISKRTLIYSIRVETRRALPSFTSTGKVGVRWKTKFLLLCACPQMTAKLSQVSIWWLEINSNGINED